MEKAKKLSIRFWYEIVLKFVLKLLHY